MSPERSLTRHHSLETRRKIGLARKGIPRSEATRQAIANSLRGKTLSKERKEKIRQTKLESNVDIDKQLWDFTIENDLLPKIVESGLLSSTEMIFLGRKFELPREKRRISDDLLDRFSIAVARVA